MLKRLPKIQLIRVSLFLLATALVVYFFTVSDNVYNLTSNKLTARFKQPSKVILLETGGSHEEVTTAMLSSLADNAVTSPAIIYPFFYLVRFGMGPIMKEVVGDKTNVAKYVNSNKLSEYKSLLGQPDVVVSVTCEYDSEKHAKEFAEFLADGVKLVCVVHHAKRWSADHESGYYKRLSPWIDKKQITFVTLSEHVKTTMMDETTTWSKEHQENLDIQVIVPVFRAPTHPQKTPMEVVGLNVQGNYSPGRRDYNHLFKELENIAKDLPSVKLYLVGHGYRPKVPDSIKNKVEFKENLPFTNYYGHMSEGFAVLPAFGSPGYFSERASSSVPASIISGVPIVANQTLLDAYSYLDLEEVWFSQDKESDIETIHRLVTGINSSEKLEKELRFRQRKIASKREQLIKRNAQIMSSLLKSPSKSDYREWRDGWDWAW